MADILTPCSTPPDPSERGVLATARPVAGHALGVALATALAVFVPAATIVI